MKIVGQKKFGPGDFSVGLVNEALAMLCKVGFTPRMLKQIADIKSGMAQRVVDVLPNPRPWEELYENLWKDWETFYKLVFDLSVDFSYIRIPDYPGLGWRLLIIAKGVGPERAFRLSKVTFGRAWKYYDASLDEVITKNERCSNEDGAYAIWVRDSQEADEIHKNKSANQIEKEGLKTETALERLVHGFKYFKETNKHLDIKTTTLCSGSRYGGGGVPIVRWDDIDDGLVVSYCVPDGAGDVLRAREVVS